MEYIGAISLFLFVLFLLLGTGMLGGFTTFSTFHYEAASMIKEKRWRKMLLYTLLTYGFSIGCALLGMWIAG